MVRLLSLRGVSRGTWLLLWVLAFLLGLPAAGARAQTVQLFVLPDTPQAQQDVARYGVTLLDGSEWPATDVRLRLWQREANGTFHDVSATATWQVIGSPFVVQQGVLVVPRNTVTAVKASCAGRDSPVYLIDVLGTFLRQSGATEQRPPLAFLDPPDMSGASANVTAALANAAQAGVPVQAVQAALGRVDIVANSQIHNAFSRSWLTDSQEALYTPAGLNANGMRLMYCAKPTIVVNDQDAAKLAAGDLLGAQGAPNHAFQLILHELMHDVIHENDVSLPVDKEESVVRDLSGQLFGDLVQINAILAMPNISVQDQIRLRNMIAHFKAFFAHLCDDLTPYGCEQVRRALGILGWDDASGLGPSSPSNGIPDTIDDGLRRRHIDPDQLPTETNPVPLVIPILCPPDEPDCWQY